MGVIMRKYLDSNIVYETKDMDKNHWLKLRKTGIGGSDAASVLGLNPYRSAMSVYLEKTPCIDEVEFIDEVGLINEVGVPIHTQIQVNHYMAVTGATHCYVAVLVGNEGLYIHKIDRDEEIIEEIMNLEAEFWEQCVLGDNIPLPDGSSDYGEVLQQYYKDSKDEELILFEQETILDRYDEINIISKEIENEKKKIEQHLKSQMKEYEIAYIGDRKVTWKKQERKSIDTKRLKKELPEIADKYMKSTTSRVFKI